MTHDPKVELVIEQAWRDFINCRDDEYFGNRTKRQHQLIVLRRLYDAAISVTDADQRRIEWQPIETAPKDGSYMLFAGSNFDGGQAVVHWSDDLEWWMLDDGKNFEIALRAEHKLTHWRPLPAPPATLTKEDRS